MSKPAKPPGSVTADAVPSDSAPPDSAHRGAAGVRSATRQADAPTQGALRRGAITGLAAARVGARQIGRKMRASSGNAEEQALRKREHEAGIGRILFAAMSQLRGTALKASQWLSMEAGFLPEAVRQELARAQYQVQPLNRALVGKVFRKTLGAEPEHLFDRFEPEAFAAASLGQVHRASLHPHGELAVKVQYPGIDVTIGSDMRLLRRVLATLGRGALHLPDASVVDRLMDELEAMLMREVDYVQEAAALQWFAQHAQHPGLVFPVPVPGRCSRQVLSQTLLPGLHVSDWLATGPSQALRDAAGQTLFDWALHCAFSLGRIQADCHPGNFLFMPDGRIGVLDLGCTRELSPGFRLGVCKAWQAMLHEGESEARLDALRQAWVGLGMLDAGIRADVFRDEVVPAAGPMQDWMVEPLRHEVFDFAGLAPAPVPDDKAQKVLARSMAGMPAELPSFDRAWIGTMHLLRQLGARVSTVHSAGLFKHPLFIETDVQNTDLSRET